MDAYDRCTNLGEKNLTDRVAVYGWGREIFRPPMYAYRILLNCINSALAFSIHVFSG